ncbi:hypothetical protein ETAA8_48280 [Anatilimnocola aggregata]|uniref:Uncharacterized protein n=1 Tax=Anatilimnocola aggregata TaxID=2528021 RepID=A0A517YHL2_9BACT|nr:hypothetical protein [Anatilimnocola aggregata]QDU29713.1 hypothetical protein ETAA8_48280 [Anatilimnocola aggregata]
MSTVRLSLAGSRLFVVVSLVLLALTSTAEAKLLRRASQPAAEPKPAAEAPAVAVAPATCAPKCCPPNICYRHHKGCVCFDPCKTVELILHVKDPCTCCLVEVPVCMPVCCTGDPTVCCYTGFLRRPVVEYSWACGFQLKVVFDRRGDITVHYYGL